MIVSLVYWHENQGVTDLPPLQESRPRDFQTRRGKEYENWIRGSLQVLMLLLLPCSAPLSLKYLMVWLRV